MKQGANEESSDVVDVLYVAQKDAKGVKTWLEEHKWLNRDYRMRPVTYQGHNTCIAIPIVDSQAIPMRVDQSENGANDSSAYLGIGREVCKYSSRVMGNEERRKACRDGLTSIQRILVDVFCERRAIMNKSCAINRREITNAVLDLSDTKEYPKSLEVFGDDRVVMLPPTAFLRDNINSSNSACTWTHFLHKMLEDSASNDENNRDNNIEQCVADFYDVFWPRLAEAHKSTRIARKGGIDANSGTRRSGTSLVWPVTGVPEETGPNTSGWVTVTEQQIRQSLDLTRVMFSRGNISEKIRFGKLVCPGEDVLDLYAGIGYFSLPALVHGRCGSLVACEWNEDALMALRYNLKQNGVEHRAQVYAGDCRESARQYSLVNRFDRVSLGLLPSSEGGWETAVRALRKSSGGWLHVHGNVPLVEVEDWATWMCAKMLGYTIGLQATDWGVNCRHVEHVKSFAPTVGHYVADVWVGPVEKFGQSSATVEVTFGRSNVVRFGPSDIDDVTIPSCAFSIGGPINQEWMC